jgi:hypothetical protein
LNNGIATIHPEDVLEAFERADYGLSLKLAMPYAIEGTSDAQTAVALLYH